MSNCVPSFSFHKGTRYTVPSDYLDVTSYAYSFKLLQRQSLCSYHCGFSGLILLHSASEVGYTSAMPRREDHESTRTCGALEKKKIYKVHTPTNALYFKLDIVLKCILKIILTCSYMFRSTTIIRESSLKPS